MSLSGTRAEDDGSASSAAAKRIFALLDKKNAPGRCTKCHSVDAGDSESIVNWRPFRPRPRDHPPTQFEHLPHFSLESEKRCSTCHELRATDFEEASDEFVSVYEGLDPHSGFASDFRSMGNERCASCHTGELAGETCTLCHNYHLGDFVPMYLTLEGTEETASARSPLRGPPHL